jgi:hypothetical protein
LQINGLTGAGDLARYEIEGDIPGYQSRRFGRGGRATNKSLHARDELGKSERFREVVVASGLQATDAIVDCTFRAEEENRKGPTRRAETFDETDSVELREHYVDDRDIVVGRLGQRQTRLAVGRVIDGVAGLLEAAHDERSDFGIIFDNEHAHGGRKVGTDLRESRQKKCEAKGRAGAIQMTPANHENGCGFQQ